MKHIILQAQSGSGSIFFGEYLPLIIIVILSFLAAEFIGRSKHIGRTYSFLMCLGIIPGIIALLFSPNANKPPTKPNDNYHWLGLLFSLLFVLQLHRFGSDSYGISSLEEKFDFIYLFSWISQIATIVYSFDLSSGSVVNKNPKIYFSESNSNTSINQSIKIDVNFKYHIIKDKNNIGPFSFEQLKTMNIYEDTLVWRNGLKEWVSAKDLEELKSLITFMPPPLPKDL